MNESGLIWVKYWSKIIGSVLCWLIYVYCKDMISLKIKTDIWCTI
jgi:hypothetical protein